MTKNVENCKIGVQKIKNEETKVNKKIVLKWIIAIVLLVLGLSFATAKNIVAMASSQYYFVNGKIGGLQITPTEDIVLDIPATINGERVTQIANISGASVSFTNAACKQYIVGINFSNADYLTTIGRGVFNGCENISGIIYLNKSITLIERYAFAGATKIEKVIVPHLDILS